MHHPKQWKEGFKNRLCHRIEYLPDPSTYDLNRRYRADDEEAAVEDEYTTSKENTNDIHNHSIQDHGV